MNRFRPNIVLEGLQAYDEDRIDELYGDGVRLKLVKACTRCRITTTNQDTGAVEGDEPLRTLRSYRYDAQLHGVCFGQNAIVIEGAAPLSARTDAGYSLARTPGAIGFACARDGAPRTVPWPVHASGHETLHLPGGSLLRI
jgi:uncharacterized protein YcbX